MSASIQPPPVCEGCGAHLSAPDAICAHCEIELADRSTDTSVGRHQCPHCQARFETPLRVLWPASAPWWRFQVHKPRCPHCSSLLRDRRQPHFKPYETLPWVTLYIVSQLFIPPKYGRISSAAALLCFLVLMVLRTERSVADLDRYAVDPVSDS